MAVALAPLAKYGFGEPASGSKLWTYAAGTTTPLASYTSSTGGTPNQNPALFNVRGEINLWLTTGVGYKLELLDPNDVLLWTVDNVLIPVAPTAGSVLPAGAAWTMLTGTFTAAAFSGQAAIPLTSFFSAYQTIFNVELTVTQQCGTSNGLTSLSLGDGVTQDRWGGSLTLTTGVKPQRSGGLPMFTTPTTLSLFSNGGVFDATGAATVRALVLALT